MVKLNKWRLKVNAYKSKVMVLKWKRESVSEVTVDWKPFGHILLFKFLGLVLEGRDPDGVEF